MVKKKINMVDLKALLKTPLGVALILAVVLALVLLTPKESLPEVLLIVRIVLGYFLIDVGVEIV